MRIWDIRPEYLCREHLLGEHRELHAIWSVIINNKKGYRHHPEVMRWRGRLPALFIRHGKLVAEMLNRGYHHYSNLSKRGLSGKKVQRQFINTINEQKVILRKKGCQCFHWQGG
jgi:hypothetical protein